MAEPGQNVDLPSIVKQDDNTFMVKGVVNMQTANSLAQQARSILAGAAGQVCIDLADVERADSAGLAVLIDWQRLARRLDISMVFKNLPEQLMQIARVSELQDILPIKD